MSTWVLLRGLTRGSGHWADFPDRLRGRLAGARIVRLDLPGNGELVGLRSLPRVQLLAPWCVERLRVLGVAPPYHLLAVSMGGMVALEWARHAPQTLAGCVLVNTSLRGLSPPHWRLRPASLAGLLRVALLPGSAETKERTILRLTSRNASAGDAVLADWSALRRAQPVSGANALRQLLAAARYRAPERPPRVPLLVLSSRRDALVDARSSAALTARWQCASAVHPSAGHDLTLDDGNWVAARIDEWLARGRPA